MEQNPGYLLIGDYYFDPARPIGKGSYGCVYQAFSKLTPNATFAVKVISMEKINEDPLLQDQVVREVQILRQLEGEHIVRLVDAVQSQANLYIFMEYCEEGDLEEILQRRGALPEEEACQIIKQIAHVFLSVDEQNIKNSKGEKLTIMHRDIKPANILFNKGKAKLADLGFAKIIVDADKDAQEAHTLLGTPLYSPPEILQNEAYSAKCDIWSAGMVFYRMLLDTVPWPANSQGELLKKIRTKPLMFPRVLKSETRDLITNMLKVDEGSRPTWKQVYEHPALK